MNPQLERADFNVIAGWIEPGQSVLDLGCGNGSLLRQLIDLRQVSGYGVEIDDANILAAVGNGINVIQSNLDAGLAIFNDDTFDHVVLSRTLQTVLNTERILLEMLRVGREAVVSFPNFGYWKNRLAVMKGRMPVSEDLPYEWYDTPNIHHVTIDDFRSLLAERDIAIDGQWFLSGERRRSAAAANLFADHGIFLLRRNGK